MSRRFSLLQTPRISLRQPVQPHKRSKLVSSSVFLAVLHLSAEGERTGVHHSVVQHLWRSPVDARLLTLLFEKDYKEHLTFVSYLILFSQRLAFILHMMRDFIFFGHFASSLWTIPSFGYSKAQPWRLFHTTLFSFDSRVGVNRKVFWSRAQAFITKHGNGNKRKHPCVSMRGSCYQGLFSYFLITHRKNIVESTLLWSHSFLFLACHR